MFDILLILVGILLAVTVGAALQCYKTLRNAQKEYEKAKDAVEDIVLSFNRQLNHEAGKSERLALKVEAISSKIGGTLKKSEEAEKSLQALESRIASALEDRDRTLSRLEEVEKKTCDAISSQATLSGKVAAIEEQARHRPAVPILPVEAVIPIKKDKALAPLTETEVRVLEMLVSEGPKTAPDIKERVELSREHTARLMKKLYEGGYLERETNKIPFKYSIKKEMEKLLRKTETEAA